jgi:hypothetical protein
MSFYRRRMFVYCFIILLIIIQPLIYIFYSSVWNCDDRIQTLFQQLPDNISDKKNIVKLNTRILCWIPTTVKRLDRAIVVHE